MRTGSILLLSLALVYPSLIPVEASGGDRPEEFRAFWVDAFHDGFKTPEQVDRLLEDVRRANANAVIVQVRRRGDAYFGRALEPRTEDPALDPGFDALQDLIDKAHGAEPRMEVHAWLATLPIWNSATPPRSPYHVFNRHGPSAQERDYWLMERVDGANRSGADFVLDPGHPDAVDYTADQYVNVVRQYPVDGIHLDLVRYMGPDWGYNPTSLQRFQSQTGRIDRPDPTDEEWKEWRRRQVDHLMRQVYLRSIAVRPDVKVSAAVIAWGAGPADEEEYRQSAPMQQVMQDWDGWLAEGTIDLALPMNYDREHVPDQRRWYDQWISWQKDRPYERHLAAGPALYLNSIDGSLAQIARAQAPSDTGNRLTGVSLYSYAVTNMDGEPREALLGALTKGTDHHPPVFAEAAAVPAIPWKEQPQRGHLMGRVRDASGTPLDGAVVELKRGKERIQVVTDGNGFFGKTDLVPGWWQVRFPQDKPHVSKPVKVEAGQVAEWK
ncbi:family 10 glycosylhydrolase [Desmospora profundinema]|uniref:Uncharacterized lipoprotein YddW (UPF0748 family) n=1 Tax=Desmospora profundinema TaxID=1571184 RepID=A0ABU1IIZ6_9BACL|nr:family 10 glycosylhydrolase [Desmospora profundinema]MDR6224726.1 uncharacterized lipoprotein YddW (UPF0748 family) [Desmospora profundinema]